MRPTLRWDIFCRVVDNLGDAGVCWRLAADLAARGDAVRLFIDDAAPLAWMAPQGAPGVEMLPWPAEHAAFGAEAIGDVVIEAFGCDPPAAFVAAMAARACPPVWINLEYLSAEAWVERAHGLPSPQRNGLQKWFFYPGFTPATGGLLREPELMARRAAFDRHAWLAARGLALREGERVVTLFCYTNAALPALLQALAATPTLLLLTPGPAQQQVHGAPAGVRLARLPWLPQTGFDPLLWAADINFVRGEDSLVRAIWAGAPFVWQAYPQDDGVHHTKVDALLERLALPLDVRAFWRAWNRAAAGPLPPWPAPAPWQAAVAASQRELLAREDLASALRGFAYGKSHPAC